MSPCIHGEVCREYLRQRRGIICRTCPKGCSFYEPKERTCHMRDASWDDGQCTWGCICSECGAKHEHELSVWMNFCPFCGAKVVKE